ncbi:hypothetical protein PVAND_012992 [Polypedilum vanderplanki]|uniref:CIDE-N domain-containing protein n=1 Tax=Polypedilum vanderplanki TaxID=319348 RepID=A0A9J6CPD5_POLVA|nr:hypothetical protein PVAND_012992 [Polypedilum vanderplanki]
MFNFFKNKTDLKGFKVCSNTERNKKYGIAADSLKSLTQKIKDKFNIDNFDLFFDGMLISDEFFKTLPNNSQIVIVKNGEEYKTDFDVVLEFFRKSHQEIFHARDLIKDFLKNNQNQDIIKAVIKLHDEIDEQTKYSSKEQHPEWFEKIENKSKEEVMRMKAKDRIKGYFYKTKDELTKSPLYRCNIQARKIIENLLNDFFLFLNGVEYFECLFDRTHDKKFHIVTNDDEIDAKPFKKRRRIGSDTKQKIKESNIFEDCRVALCNDLGVFNCHGAYTTDRCGYEHKINPYSSRESLILFQIFNLDHQIEISRSIFPSILKNVEKLCEGKEIICEKHKKECTELSTLTYFFEIFTIRNLKLVHIICHDKGSHDLNTKAKLLCSDCKEAKMIRKLNIKIS